jgi:hypothetical protein
MRIVNYLAAVNGYRHYLELCTPTTGNLYRELDRLLFVTCRRLMYKCNTEFDDGLEIDFRSPDFNIDDCLKQIVETKIRPDIVLVDPWHEYDTSFRDIAKAFELVPPGGSLLVHDCLPPSLSVASPEYVPGDWCGVTYKAYVDFVSGRSDLEFKTVNTDYGCGVIRKAGPGSQWRQILNRLHRKPSQHRLEEELIQSWRSIDNDYASAFCFFQKHNKELLNLISLDDFIEQNRRSIATGF